MTDFTKTDTFRKMLETAGMGKDAKMEAHYAKEKIVFKNAHTALAELMKFLNSQDEFEKERGKEGEYSEMKKDVEDLVKTMKKHLSEY